MVIFGAGVITGGLLVRQTVLVPPPRLPHAGAVNRSVPTAPGFTRVEFLRRAERELNLTPAQREQTDKIIAASQDRTKKIMEPVTPKIRDELQQTKDEFRALLTSEQQAKFDEMLKKQAHSRDQQHRPQGKAGNLLPESAP
jgi:Spy/CpxP family protein refolding chaperone